MAWWLTHCQPFVARTGPPRYLGATQALRRHRVESRLVGMLFADTAARPVPPIAGRSVAGSLQRATCWGALLASRAHTTPLNAEVATPQQAAPMQTPQVGSMVEQRRRMDQIGELLRAKGCSGSAA
jgi:hypothetical protein